MAEPDHTVSLPFNLQRELDQSIPLGQKLQLVHEAIKRHSGAIHRIAVTLYDARTDMLSTFIHSTDGQSPLLNYSARLAEVASLNELARHGTPRVSTIWPHYPVERVCTPGSCCKTVTAPA